ncbi:HigA family addiction module antitoxin [Bartonella krasnovii]|uniref:HigA family addiction module antitoxin n=1 Tax=Bartonella krasnovii TaxID=2267275 RepID=UPI001F4D215E|nr:HigA family addiction module antitoxin [Bartonella krasnovii]UNF39721.1 HigA family addiction module antitoxin [Bartonella krasnovii]UNF44725.1 HigA family addiction module antitoxin [Bartonella krasnovii]UNF51264.1 HigA family addiction module antitoxin [Bartonella krasnovii]
MAIHPGEILREEYLKEYALSAYALAKALNVPRTRIERIVAENSPVTPDTVLRLAYFFDTTAEFWLNMQAAYDVSILQTEKADEFAKINKFSPINKFECTV